MNQTLARALRPVSLLAPAVALLWLAVDAEFMGG